MTNLVLKKQGLSEATPDSVDGQHGLASLPAALTSTWLSACGISLGVLLVPEGEI